MPEFPASVYRHGDEFEWDGERFDALTVNDEDELADSLKHGWSLGKPADKRKAGRPHKAEPDKKDAE